MIHYVKPNRRLPFSDDDHYSLLDQEIFRLTRSLVFRVHLRPSLGEFPRSPVEGQTLKRSVLTVYINCNSVRPLDRTKSGRPIKVDMSSV